VSERYDHAELSELPARDFIARWHEHATVDRYRAALTISVRSPRKKEEENVVARGRGGGDGGEGEGTRVHFCVPVRSP
ncbi:hypothetical protein ALC57_11964, partial [Trachymyrmex cornetzi]